MFFWLYADGGCIKWRRSFSYRWWTVVEGRGGEGRGGRGQGKVEVNWNDSWRSGLSINNSSIIYVSWFLHLILLWILPHQWKNLLMFIPYQIFSHVSGIGPASKTTLQMMTRFKEVGCIIVRFQVLSGLQWRLLPMLKTSFVEHLVGATFLNYGIEKGWPLPFSMHLTSNCSPDVHW